MDKRKRRDQDKNKEIIMPMPPRIEELPKDYSGLLRQLKERIQSERLKTVLSANVSLILMYWDIGCNILKRQHKSKWGAKVIDRLSIDLKESFPEMSGFSARNLKYMRKFSQMWPDKDLVQRTVAQIPWRTNLTLLEKVTDPRYCRLETG